MADEVKTEGTPPSTTEVRPDGQPPVVSQAPRSDEPLRNIGEVVALRREVRGIETRLGTFDTSFAEIKQLLTAGAKPPAPPTAEATPSASGAPASPADAVARVERLERDITLERALGKAQVTDPTLRELLTVAAPSKASEVEAFVSKYAKQPSQQQTTQNAPGRSDTGAPGINPQALIPDNPNEIDPQVLASMSTADRKARVAAWLAKGGNRNPMRGERANRRK